MAGLIFLSWATRECSRTTLQIIHYNTLSELYQNMHSCRQIPFIQEQQELANSIHGDSSPQCHPNVNILSYPTNSANNSEREAHIYCIQLLVVVGFFFHLFILLYQLSHIHAYKMFLIQFPFHILYRHMDNKHQACNTF